MIDRNNRKLVENLMKVNEQEIDNVYLQDELLQLENVIENISTQLSVAELDNVKVQSAYQLIQICNNVLDQINTLF